MTDSEHHDFDGITENREQRPPVYFTVLFYGLIIWGVAFCAFYLLSGWSSQAEFQVKIKAHEAQFQATSTPAAKTGPQSQPAEPPPAPQTPVPATAPVAAAASSAAATPDAKALFEAQCTGCHGAGGKGGFGPDLTAPVDKFEYGKTRQALFTSIAQGRGNGKMPAFEGQLKREEIYALADYILTLK